jgi:mono/diheme cytochrome c family protein
MSRFEIIMEFLSQDRATAFVLRPLLALAVCASTLVSSTANAEMTRYFARADIAASNSKRQLVKGVQEIPNKHKQSEYLAIKMTKVQIKHLLPGAIKRMRALGVKCRSKKKSDIKKYQGRNGACDKDGDKIPNFLENRIGTNYRLKDTDGDGLTDRDEILKYNTDPLVADTDGDGLTDGDEINRTHTDPLNPDSDGNGIVDGIQYPIPSPSPVPTPGPGECSANNFDGSGNTNQFQIPSPLVGNSGRGQTIYQAQVCFRCHGVVEKGTNLTYPQLNAALVGPLMGASLTALGMTPTSQQTADLVAWLNRTQTARIITCPATATPTPTPFPTFVPTPTISPTITATPTPIGTPCAGGNFDGSGNTTAFAIPSPLIGNITAGSTQYNTTCVNCHNPSFGERGGGYDFNQLKTAFNNNPGMKGQVLLTDQQIANVIAFVNRGNAGGCSSPTPTPTPLSPAARGAQIFGSSCALSGCHSLSSGGSPRNMDRHPSESKIHNALWSGPDEMPQFRYMTIGQTAPPFTADEDALFAYLRSLP